MDQVHGINCKSYNHGKSISIFYIGEKDQENLMFEISMPMERVASARTHEVYYFSLLFLVQARIYRAICGSK